ncbi:MAG: response regulator [Candidatus Rokubacteria bacterium]|nr:response regulator [Candidatus Rokubacteria bacterium]
METILVADDAPDILALARDILEARGYTVLTAADGEEALRLAEGYAGPIHALLADVVMPGLTGPELAERLTRTRHETKVVFMSGYTTEVMDQYGLLHSGAPFIGKPFTPDLLVRKVREALDYRSPFARPPAPARPALAGSRIAATPILVT